MNNSSLLEKTDIENKMTEIPLETIIPPKANTVKCIHCGKSYTSRRITTHSKSKTQTKDKAYSIFNFFILLNSKHRCFSTSTS